MSERSNRLGQALEKLHEVIVENDVTYEEYPSHPTGAASQTARRDGKRPEHGNGPRIVPWEPARAPKFCSSTQCSTSTSAVRVGLPD